MSVSKFDPKTDTLSDSHQSSGPKGDTPLSDATPPGAASVTVTPTAMVHMQQQIQRSGQRHIRLGVKESGCNGYMYTLDFVDTPTATDIVLDVKPVNSDADPLELVIANADLALVNFTEIDLVTEGLNSSLAFKNPNAESHCGCGESFSVAAAGS